MGLYALPLLKSEFQKYIIKSESIYRLEDSMSINKISEQDIKSYKEEYYKKCLTPYKELRPSSSSLERSIYDYIKEDYSVPDKVIAYLHAGQPAYMCPGVYKHPFKNGETLLGPYVYTDGYYTWDRDTWKYVIKYRLTLPEAFIDHVMSEKGTAFIAQRIDESEEWSDVIKAWKKREGFMCMLPDNAGEIELENF